MYYSIFICFIYFAITVNANIIPWPPKEKYIVQRTDHFSFPAAEMHFRQRYLYEDKWFKPGGPIFFYCGNEATIDSTWNHTGFMFEIASSFGAFILFGEHRYYGKSLPFLKSFEQPWIKFLSLEQALADYAYLIGKVKKTHKLEKSTVIAFGGSYGGELAAYARVLYPHIFHGALAASAPVLWTSGIGNIHSFFESTTKNYAAVDPQCVNVIRTAYTELTKLGDKGAEGLKEASAKLRLCDPLTNQRELEWAMKWTRNAFVMLSMKNYPYKVGSVSPMPANPVNVSCHNAIKAGKTDAIAGLREAVAVMYNITKDLSCFPYKTQFIECADITGCGLGNDAYAWDFQSCTEIHLYDGSNATAADMFPSLPLTRAAVDQYCLARWGVSRVETQLATFFSPEVWKSTSNIIFSNGDLDPWRNGGILKDITNTVTTILIHGGAHCFDLHSSNPLDPQSVKEARQIEVQAIWKWIKPKFTQKNGTLL